MREHVVFNQSATVCLNCYEQLHLDMLSMAKMQAPAIQSTLLCFLYLSQSANAQKEWTHVVVHKKFKLRRVVPSSKNISLNGKLTHIRSKYFAETDSWHIVARLSLWQAVSYTVSIPETVTHRPAGNWRSRQTTTQGQKWVRCRECGISVPNLNEATSKNNDGLWGTDAFTRPSSN